MSIEVCAIHQPDARRVGVMPETQVLKPPLLRRTELLQFAIEGFAVQSEDARGQRFISSH